jgi:hypothetical protein
MTIESQEQKQSQKAEKGSRQENSGQGAPGKIKRESLLDAAKGFLGGIRSQG